MIQEIWNKPVLIFGCGNVLLGDDGFGPAVVERLLRRHTLPPHVFAIDMGTSVRNVLLDLLLSPRKPKNIFIVDAVSQSDRRVGEVFELPVQELPLHKSDDFSVHQFPSLNLLMELREDAGVDVRVLVVQTKELPREVCPGLSSEVEASLSHACEWLWDRVKECA